MRRSAGRRSRPATTAAAAACRSRAAIRGRRSGLDQVERQVGVEQRRQRGPDRECSARNAAKAACGRRSIAADQSGASAGGGAPIPALSGRDAAPAGHAPSRRIARSMPFHSSVTCRLARGRVDVMDIGASRGANHWSAVGSRTRFRHGIGLHGAHRRHLHRHLHGADRRLARRRALSRLRLDRRRGGHWSRSAR